MTVKELKEELSYYDDDADIVFEVDDEFEPESITESKYGWQTARIRSNLEITFSSERHGYCYIEFGKKGEE